MVSVYTILKATDLISSLFNITSVQDAPFHHQQHTQWTYVLRTLVPYFFLHYHILGVDSWQCIMASVLTNTRIVPQIGASHTVIYL